MCIGMRRCTWGRRLQRAMCCIRTRRNKSSVTAATPRANDAQKGVGTGPGFVAGKGATRAKILPLVDEQEPVEDVKAACSAKKKKGNKDKRSNTTRAATAPSATFGNEGAVKVKKGNKAKRSYEKLGDGLEDADAAAAGSEGTCTTNDEASDLQRDESTNESVRPCPRRNVEPLSLEPASEAKVVGDGGHWGRVSGMD